MALEEKSPWLPPPSIKVGLSPVAVKVGSSLSAATVTVEATERAAMLSLEPLLEPLSTISVRVTTRLLPVEGSCAVFLY